MQVSLAFTAQEIIRRAHMRDRSLKSHPLVIEGSGVRAEQIRKILDTLEPSLVGGMVDMAESPSLAYAMSDFLDDTDLDSPERMWRREGIKSQVYLLCNCDYMRPTDVELFWAALYRGYEMAPTLVLTGGPGLADILSGGEFQAGRDFTVMRIEG